MPDLALKYTDTVNVWDVQEQVDGLIADSDIDAGAPCLVDATTGRARHSDADGAGLNVVTGIAPHKALAGEAITLIRKGKMAGWVLDALGLRAKVYVSNTIGKLADAAGTASLPVGEVMPSNSNTAGNNPDKYLQIDIRA